MAKKEEFEPQDSASRPPKDDQAVITQKQDQGLDRKEAKTTAPALKRKFSEQPPTKHNSKT